MSRGKWKCNVEMTKILPIRVTEMLTVSLELINVYGGGFVR